MYTLKSIVQRSALFGAAGALVVATFAPGVSVFASSLTPLTDRSLLLSSSAPGYVNTDGSGYTSLGAGNPNPSGDGVVGDSGTDIPYSYAPAGSGPNGMKTGEKFTFKVSSEGTVKGFSFQYCTTAAGLCKAPGNNTGDERNSDREDNAGAGNAWENSRSDLDITGTFAKATSEAAPVAGQFQISVNGNETAVDNWVMTSMNAEDNGWVDGSNPSQIGLTGKNNYLVLYSPTGIALQPGQEVTVDFKASESVYITNPGQGSFFVKINTYDTDDYADAVDTDGDDGDGTQGYTNLTPLDGNQHVIDGGVTVANVMTDSIHIVTKVLETMSFSVGIQNPDTVDKVGNIEHGTCEPISQSSTITGLQNNRINLGEQNAEFSLSTENAYDAYSYWRLSSNSSGGATVYYSGATLSNTSGDQIADMQTEQASNPGTEQFGLGFVDAGLDKLANALVDGVDDEYVDGGDTFQTGHVTPRSYPFITLSTQTGAPYSGLAAQSVSTGYDEATGTIDDGLGGAGTAKFQFHGSSLTVPRVIAQQNEMVISCATAKMRYVGNIGADTPAGVYTTKVNYLAAPQY